MEIYEITKEEYSKKVLNPFTRFNKVDFYELNKHKVDELKYFIFNDGKDRFSLVGGIKENFLKFPFSASFESLIPLSSKNQIVHYHETIKSLIEWSKEYKIAKILFSLPPEYYGPSHISRISNALFVNGFKLQNIDVNYDYFITEMSIEDKMTSKSRQIWRKGKKEGLVFEKTDNFESVYNIIKENRLSKGYPLWMSLEDIKNTAQIIPSDLFIVKSLEGKGIASALCHHIRKDIIRVVYWGNLPDSDVQNPMYFLCYNLFKYYKDDDNIKIIDIGISTENSIPNYGLCDFKEKIGCTCSEKKTFCLEITRNL